MKLPTLFCTAVIATSAFYVQADVPAPKASPEVSQIVITQYTGGEESSPQFIQRMVLNRSGNAIYVGSQTYAKRVGRYQGVINQGDFQQLATLLQSDKSAAKSTSYNAYNGRQVASVKYEFSSAGRKRAVMVYEDSGPKLYKRGFAIYSGLIAKIQWRKVSASDAIDR